jgi:hypothetical protein
MDGLRLKEYTFFNINIIQNEHTCNFKLAGDIGRSAAERHEASMDHLVGLVLSPSPNTQTAVGDYILYNVFMRFRRTSS